MSDSNYLVKKCRQYKRDPWGFVMWAFDWGEGELSGHWPEPIQETVLKSIRDQLAEIPEEGEWEKVIREALSTGHGPGKSTLIAWICLWGLSTLPHTRVVITANTEPQLRTKTLPEIRKWHRLCRVGHWFHVTATAVFSINKESEKTWRADLIPWSEHRPEAFAGLHNEGKRVVILFDEASSIAESIWETTEGALTDLNTEIIFCAFGNPTRRDGYFAKIFGSLRHRWNTRRVDARDSRLTNKTLIAEWIADHGIDSNFVRVRVLGLHPTSSSDTLIDELWIKRAMESNLQSDETDQGKLICDVARFGEDQTVIAHRCGPEYRELEKYQGKDLMKTTGRLKNYYDDGRYDQMIDGSEPLATEYIVIDDTGLGGGVTDRLEEQKVDVRPFLGGETAHEEGRFRNKRDEAWWSLREAFRKEEINLIDIEDPDELIQQLTMLTYDYHSSGQIHVEPRPWRYPCNGVQF